MLLVRFGVAVAKLDRETGALRLQATEKRGNPIYRECHLGETCDVVRVLASQRVRLPHRLRVLHELQFEVLQSEDGHLELMLRKLFSDFLLKSEMRNVPAHRRVQMIYL